MHQLPQLNLNVPDLGALHASFSTSVDTIRLIAAMQAATPAVLLPPPIGGLSGEAGAQQGLPSYTSGRVLMAVAADAGTAPVELQGNLAVLERFGYGSGHLSRACFPLTHIVIVFPPIQDDPAHRRAALTSAAALNSWRGYNSLGDADLCAPAQV